MKKSVSSDTKLHDMHEAQSQHVPAAGSTGKPNTVQDIVQELKEQEAGRDIIYRTEDNSSRSDSGAGETNY